jgi:hypothetical protein
MWGDLSKSKRAQCLHSLRGLCGTPRRDFAQTCPSPSVLHLISLVSISQCLASELNRKTHLCFYRKKNVSSWNDKQSSINKQYSSFSARKLIAGKTSLQNSKTSLIQSSLNQEILGQAVGPFSVLRSTFLSGWVMTCCPWYSINIQK